MNKRNFTALSVAIGLASSASALGGTLTEAQYKATGQGITARHASDEVACQAMAGNARDVCMAQANGRASVATAELEASRENTGEHRNDVRIARANAAYAVANEKCDDLAGNAQDVCRKEAQAAEVAAKAEAEQIEKTADANATARDASADAARKAATEKRDAAYAVAREKCDALVADAKASCIAEAKTRHGQS